MPARLPSGVDDSWTDDLTLCSSSGVGYSTNIGYRHNGQPTHEHEFEDTCFRFQHDDSTWLYGVFDGHDGKGVAEFAAQKLPAELLLGQLDGKRTDDEIKEILKQAFTSVEHDYFLSIDDLLTKRATLLADIPDNLNTYETTQKYPEKVKQLQELNQRIAGGSSATVALIYGDRLFIASVGNCRALLCKTDASKRLRVIQLNSTHDADNPEEAARLVQLGLNTESVRHFLHPTRCIGDYARKGGYKDIDFLKDATKEPVCAEPEISKVQLDDGCNFLMLMTSGVYAALQDASDVSQVNPDLAALTAREFGQQTTLTGTAQAVVDEIGRRHHDAFFTDRGLFCQQRNDMTLLIRNFNYPIGVHQNQLNSINSNASASHHPQATNSFTNETLTDQTNTLVGTDATVSTNWSDEGSVNQNHYVLPLDEEGRVEAYVDFSEFYEAVRIRKMENEATVAADTTTASDMSGSVSSVDD